MPLTEKPKLRVGLLVDSLTQPQWVNKIVKDIINSDIAEVVLIVKNEAEHPRQKSSIFKTLLENRQHILRKFYTVLDDRIFRSEPDPFKLVNLAPLLGHCPIVGVNPEQTKYSDYFPEVDVSTILDYNLDVAFRFGFRILKGDSLKIARHGVWSYHHGDNLAMRGGPAGFWEVMEGHPATGAILQILTPELDDGKVLYRSWASTFQYSVRRNKENYYWKTSEFALRKLRELYELGPSALEADKFAATYYPYNHRLYKAPDNGEMLWLLIKLGSKVIGRGLQKLFYRREWFLAYKFSKSGQISTAFHNAKLIRPPKNYFWADPFPLKKGDTYFIFIEEFEFRVGKGWISVIELDQTGAWKAPVKVLETDYHLSHPFVFEWQNQYYMIPETLGKQTIELYRCTSFPFEWKLEKVLIENVRAVDATLAEIGGLWWMFVNMAVEGASTNDELHLFFADTPFGPWQPHKRNPVKSDVRSARPAGNLFYYNGELLRPAQDSSLYYGYAISINKIVCLTPDTFVEEEVSKLLPKWRKGLQRNHTLNHAGDLTIVDGLQYRRRFF